MSELLSHLLTPSTRLRYIRGLLGVSRAYLEKKYGISQATLKSWESGSVKITEDGVNRCVSFYRAEGLILSHKWILMGEGLEPRLAPSLLTLHDYQKSSVPLQEDDELLALEEAVLFQQKGEQRITMMVSTDEMMPFFCIGDLIGGRLRYEQDIDQAVNKNSIVILESGDKIFRRVIKSENGKYHLVLLNPNCDTREPVLFDVQIHAAAPVIWHRRIDA